LVVWIFVRMTASDSLSKTGAQWFGEAKECSYIYRVNKAGTSNKNEIKKSTWQN